MESVRAIKKYLEATSINKSKVNIKGLLIQKMDIQVMNITGEGIPSQINNTVQISLHTYSHNMNSIT